MEEINGATTVREIVTRYPGSEEIFEKHGLGGCGGEGGPTEPVGFFAAVHHVDAGRLISELNEYAAAPSGATDGVSREPTPPPSPPATVGHTYPLFLAASLLLTLVIGLTTGVASAITGGWDILDTEPWLAMVQAHGHVQVYGFLGLFIMGTAYHILPRFKGIAALDRRLVLSSFWLFGGGVFLRMAAQPHGQTWLRWPMAVSGLMELAGAALFTALIAGMLIRARDRRESFDRILVAASGFFLLSAAINAYLTFDAALAGSRLLNLAGDAAFLEATVHGFVLLFVLGVSFRVLPFFMRLNPAYSRLRDGAFLLLVLGVGLRTLATWAPAFGAATWAPGVVREATFVTALAAVGLVVALRIFESPEEGRPEASAAPLFPTFARTAYVWLLVSLGLDVYWRLREIEGGFTPFYAAGAVRHALLLGFATLMILGMAYRTVPVFSGRAIGWPKLIPLVYGVAMAATVLRVAPVALTTDPSGLDFQLMTAGGVLLFVAIGVFAAQLAVPTFGWWTASEVAAMQTVAPPHADEEPITVTAVERPAAATNSHAASASVAVANGKRPIASTMTVAEALAVSPAMLDAFLDAGFRPLADPEVRARMAPTITVERAAAVIEVDPQRLLEGLNTWAFASLPAPDEGGPPVYLDVEGSPVSEYLLLTALRSCYDPEIPANIVDLGLVYGVIARGDAVRVSMTLTSPGCPMGEQVRAEVIEALLAVPGVATAEVELVYRPPWTPERMSKAARAALGWT